MEPILTNTQRTGLVIAANTLCSDYKRGISFLEKKEIFSNVELLKLIEVLEQSSYEDAVNKLLSSKDKFLNEVGGVLNWILVIKLS